MHRLLSCALSLACTASKRSRSRMAGCSPHSTGRSQSRATPIPWGSRPSIAALTRSGGAFLTFGRRVNGEQVLESRNLLYLRRVDLPRRRRGLWPDAGFVAAANCPPIIKRYPLPPHPMHSMPSCKPVPRHCSHGTGVFSLFGGLTDMRIQAVSRRGHLRTVGPATRFLK
jgi:hypothetical protein